MRGGPNGVAGHGHGRVEALVTRAGSDLYDLLNALDTQLVPHGEIAIGLEHPEMGNQLDDRSAGHDSASLMADHGHGLLFEGEMIERMHVDAARRVLARVGRS